MDEQQIEDELAFPDFGPGDAWGESITKKRVAELEALLHTWETEQELGERKGPFDGILLKGADVFWLAARGWGVRNGIAMTVAAIKLTRGDVSMALNMLHLEGACLRAAHLEGACLHQAHLEGAILREAHLEGAILSEAHLEGAFLAQARLEDAHLKATHLEGARLYRAHLERANLRRAHLEGTNLNEAHLENARLREAHLEGVGLRKAHLEGANLREAHLEGKQMLAKDVASIRQWAPRFPDKLAPARMRLVVFDSGTTLNGITLGTSEFGYASLADVCWSDVNLAVVNWTQVRRRYLRLYSHIEVITLGDEREARTTDDGYGKPRDKATQLSLFQTAIRANRQLAIALRNQGLNEDADRFAYKAQALQREALRRQGNFGGYAFSLLLWMLSGYGYRLWRIAAAYGLVLLIFAVIFLALGVHSYSGEPGIQALWDSFLVSLSAIHGRTFFEQVGAWSPAAWVAAIESVVGIVIEGIFVAMLIQRFFSR